MIKEYSSLHGHSHFSIGDGLSTPEENVKAAKEKGLKSVALTDHGVNHGHADMFLAGKKHGVRTVFGVEAYVIHDLDEWNRLREILAAEKKSKGKMKDSLEESTVGQTHSQQLRKKGHLVLLACNRKGLANINQLVYLAHRDGFYGKPRIDKKLLRIHSEGLIASTACMGGVISKRCWDMKDGKATWEDVVQEAREFNDIFGMGRFFLELQFNELDASQNFINQCMVRLHEETHIPLTVTTDFHYSKQEEWQAREILHMLDWDQTIEKRGGKIETEIKQLYVKSAEEMWNTYVRYASHAVPEHLAIQAFQNTLLMDSLVEDYEPDTHQRLPTLPYEDPFKEMGERAIAGLRRLGLAEREEYQKQLLHELKVIRDKGFSSYFIIVQEIIAEAKKTQLVGAGRGSAAGSLVCYALGITDFDPVKGGLMFERFLDPTRLELPDIDIDFEDVEATKDTLRRMFGKDNVACLSTYNTYQAKGLLKDLARVYGVENGEMNRLNKMIEKELKTLYINQDKSTIVIRLEDIERVSPTFNRFVEEHPELGTQFKRLYGRNSHIGRHASGVVIGDNLSAETAIFTRYDKKTDEDIVQTSFTEGIVNKNLSAMGLVKFDILSIATLKIIHHALKLISQKTGQPIEELRESIRPHNLDLNDPHVIKHVFVEGNFAGIFQFTERGIRGLAKKIKPDCFDDVSAVTSLYRPGPLGSGMHKLYAENKVKALAGELVYEHPLLENILKRTHGCLVYQEQLMQIAQHLGSMEFKDVQRIRKVLLKKDKSKSPEFLKKENDELQEKFITGCVKNGMEQVDAERWWKNLLFFGGYGFNIAHSYTYSVMTMQCAHLATYHPLEFYAAMLTKGQSGEMQEYISDIKKTGIKILPVDVNESRMAHITEDGKIRLSLLTPDGVGPAAVEKIMAGQPYRDFRDFLDRSGVGKTGVDPLIKVGAFDCLFKNSKVLEKFYLQYIADPKLKQKKNRDQLDLLWNHTLSEAETEPDYQLFEKVGFENELMTFSLRGSPFEILDRKEKLGEIYGDTIPSYKDFMEGDDDVGIIPVVIKEIKEKPQKNGKLFAFLKFAAESGEEFEAPCFANIWQHVRLHVYKGAVYVVTFNRPEDDPENLLVGRPGFSHSQKSSLGYFVNIDEVQL